MMICVLMLSDCRANVHCREKRKYISLNGSDKQFDQIDKGYHQRTYDTNGIGLKDKTQRDES